MLNQIFAVTALNLRSIGARLGSSLVIVIGIAGVVGVLTSLLAMSKGFEATLGATGRDDRALVLRGGSSAELNSGLSADNVQAIKDTRGASGTLTSSAEMIVITEFASKARGGSFNVTLRAVEQSGFQIRPEFRMVDGRKFEPGLQEVIVGKDALNAFEGVSIGSNLRFRGGDWKVVGVFETGDSHDSELWADLATAQTAFGRTGTSSVLVQLEDKDGFDAFAEALKEDPRVNVDVKREKEYFSGQSGQFRLLIGILSTVVGSIMGLGALFAALNTMYAAVSTRTTEIATLRAIGFGSTAVVVSVVAEAITLALLGGVIGAAISWLLFNGYSASTLGQGFTQVAFEFQVTPQLMSLGLFMALFLGFLGGLLPAIRAARLPVTVALRGA
ncbi:MAG: FtsX-like permease family protein [Xanthomonadales bacterium]|nr:FtsX-like permease family protein [Xanthomonadales bacterium]